MFKFYMQCQKNVKHINSKKISASIYNKIYYFVIFLIKIERGIKMEAKSHSKSKKTIGDEPPSLQKTKEYENKIKIDDSNWYKISTTETLKRLDSNKEQ